MYDPTIGRWITEDAEGFQAGDANLYRYLGNNAPNATDPSGLELPSPQYRIAPRTQQEIAADEARAAEAAENWTQRRLDPVAFPVWIGIHGATLEQRRDIHARLREA